MNNTDILTNIEYLHRAFKKSKTRRSYTVSSVLFEDDLFANLEQIAKEIENKTFRVSGYTEFDVSIPKQRHIKACKFRDKVVQHVLCDNILAPMLPDICIHDNYAGQKGKGTGLARERLRENLMDFYSENGESGFIYKADIRKYYYNIVHEKAKDIMNYYFPEEIHWLIDEFIDSTIDDTEKNAGIALGNQINTIVSCLYLDGMDKFIVNELGIRYYGRYADDFYLIHKDKERLKECAAYIKEFLETLGLELNQKSQIMPFKNGISFLGFHFYVRNWECIIRLDNGKKRAYRRKFNRMHKLVKNGKLEVKKLEESYKSWKNHAMICTDKTIFNYYEQKMREVRT